MLPAVLLLPALGCIWLIRPSGAFGTTGLPAAPDYARGDSWAALPDRRDAPDVVPVPALRDNQDRAPVDVFFLHPTMYFGRTWNADLSDSTVRARTDNTTMRQQASVFNCCARIFAPRYRQATLYAFIDTGTGGRQALDLAYEDVRQAFRFYLERHNQGRGIIVAGHSQGSLHAVRLLREFFDSEEGRRNLVAAYVIGFHVRAQDFRVLKPCASVAQVGCFVSYRTVGVGAGVPQLPLDPPGISVCVNPISWRMDPKPVPAQDHPGGVPDSFDRIDRGIVGARCRSDGLLEITEPALPGYAGRSGNYHVRDYGLFYMSIRENVQARVRAFGGQRLLPLRRAPLNSAQRFSSSRA